MSQDGQPATCPECGPTGPTFPSFEDLGVHLERHREVPPAAPKSIECRGGCGRFMPTKRSGKVVRDWKHHEELCDGSDPILQTSANPPDVPADPIRPTPTQEERTMAAGKCPKCSKTYKRLGSKFDAHVSSCDGTPVKAAGKPREARRASGTGASGAEDVAPAVQQLRETEAKLRDEAATLIKRADLLRDKADELAEV